MKTSSHKPNFLLVGAARSGTGSLYNYLSQHPQVFVPERKELRFFVNSFYQSVSSDDPTRERLQHGTINNYDEYLECFADAGHYPAIGEATVAYLYFYSIAIPKIKKYLGDIKILIILRNPVERAYSAYRYMVSKGNEKLSFDECLEKETQRIRNKWAPMRYYHDFGFYYKQVKAYLDSFNNVKVVLNDDLENNPLALLEDVFTFLEVDNDFVPDVNQRYNLSGERINEGIHRIRSGQNLFARTIRSTANRILPRKGKRTITDFLQKTTSTKISEMGLITRETLRKEYRDDIVQLQELIGKDLSNWLD